MRAYGLDLPEYPWETLIPYRKLAAEHPGGTVDLSIGTPVDDTPQLIQDALAAASDAPGYPTTHGTVELRQAIVDWFARRRGVTGLSTDQVMPTVGSKELVAWLPFLLGLGTDPGTQERDVVVYPRVAYPTYDIGARFAGAQSVPADSLDELPEDVRRRVRLVWVNSPANPNGVVRDVAELREIVRQARDIGAVVASDECYAELGWGAWDEARGGQRVPSILDPRVCDGNFTGLFAAYSLSKQSNLAGYRAAFIAGDAQLMPNLINSRKHAGMIVPAPVQRALIAALGDEAHVAAQKNKYRARREELLAAITAAGGRVENSEAGLYLWTTFGEDTWASIERLAKLGIVAGPGVFYGEDGAGYVRIALTASDEDIAKAAERLTASAGIGNAVRE